VSPSPKVVSAIAKATQLEQKTSALKEEGEKKGRAIGAIQTSAALESLHEESQKEKPRASQARTPASQAWTRQREIKYGKKGKKRKDAPESSPEREIRKNQMGNSTVIEEKKHLN